MAGTFYSNKSASSGFKKKTYNKAPIVKKPRKVCEWSDYQIAIFKDIATGTGNTQIDAFAGSGKSSSIQEGLYHMSPGTKALAVAFAKPIQIEMEKYTPEGVDVLTLHSLGFRASRKVFTKVGKPDDKGEKLWGFINADRGDDPETNEVRENIARAVSLCKGYLADSPSQIDPILDRHDVDTCGESRESFITSVIKVLNACKKDTSRMDFDDMIWFPNIHPIPIDHYGMVFIDEAQDLNIAQINIALKSAGPTGRVISVGDERQAIYGFRGADSNAIQNIVSRCNSKRLPLSVSYRCARAIVELAQTLVPGIEAAPHAEEGLVSEIGDNQLERLVQPGDFILSRTNAPLLKWCLNLLKARIPANIQGRDLGKTLFAMIKKSKASNVDDFLGWLNEWKDIECERLLKAKRDTAVVLDKAECLSVLCEGTRNLEEVKDNLDKLFKDGDDHSRVILSTTHKAKGLERERCFVLQDTYKIGKNIEESNLAYVAWTRAKMELYLVRKG